MNADELDSLTERVRGLRSDPWCGNTTLFAHPFLGHCTSCIRLRLVHPSESSDDASESSDDAEAPLFHGDALRQIARLIDVAAAAHSDVIRQ